MTIDIKYEDIIDVYFSDGVMHIRIREGVSRDTR